MEWLVSCTIFYRLSDDAVLYEQFFPTRARADQEIAAILDERENERLHRVALCMEPLAYEAGRRKKLHRRVFRALQFLQSISRQKR